MTTKKPKKTGDDLTIRIRDLRKEIKKKVENELLQQYNKAQTEGKYPWEGMWLKPHDIEKIQKIMKKKDRIVFAEIIALFLLMALFSCGAYIFIIAVLPG